MAQDTATTTELTIDVACTPRNRANLRRLKTTSIQSFQRWEKENELLYAMIEDESTWLSRLFPDTFVTPELFFYALEDGTILCLLANFIQEMAENYGARSGTPIPGKKFTFHKSKKGTRESKLFHSRENVDKFLTWCRWHGIPEAILFESNDAVMVDECRTGGREIVICLMEIARRSSRYEIEDIPQLIKLEREIDEEELSDVQRCAEEQQGLVIALDTGSVNTGSRGDRSPIDSDSGVESVFEGDPSSPRLLEFVEIPQETTKEEPKNKSINKFEGDNKGDKVMQKAETHALLESSQPKTELDKKVCKVAQEYNIKIVHRLKEGKYIILGKTMFVRMLNDHLLVRIGGGWDTLDHYVMTHAQKSTGPEGIKTKTPSSERKSSGVWSKFIDKVKRRDSQPNLTDSPVVISKRERPESSPSVYRLRDRVKKKLSVTEKDEKDITAAIRKIETNLSQSGKSSSSPSFTSKTFFQLKNRFDKGRKSSRENLLEKKRKDKMADQNGDMITSEEQTKREEISTTSLLESEIALEPKTMEASNATEEFSTSTTTVVSEFSSHELKFDSGKDDFPAQVTSAETSLPFGEEFLLFDQQTQQSELQNTNDLFSNDNPPLFQSETLQPEQAQDKEQVEMNKEDDNDDDESSFPIPSAADQKVTKSDKDFPVDFTQGIEPKSAESSPESEEEKPDSFGLEETELTPDIETQLKKDIQEPSIGDQTDLSLEVSEEIDSEPIKASPKCEEAESAPVVLLQQSDQPELNQGEQQYYEEEKEMPIEQVEDVADESEQRDNESPAEVQSYNAAPLEEQLQSIYPVQLTREELESPETAMKDMEPAVSQEGEDIGKGYKVEVESETVPTEEEHLEDIPPIQNTRDVESHEIAVKDTEHVVSQDEDIGKDDVVQVETEAESVPREEEQPEDIHPVQFTSENNYEVRENDGEVQVLEIGVQDMIDISKVSKELEAPDERERLRDIVDEKVQDTSVEQDTSLETSPVVEPKTIMDEKETLANMVDVEETRPQPEEIPSVSPVVEPETIMDEKETLANMVDVEETQPEEIPSLRPVVESETIMDEKETLANTVDVEKTRPQPEEIPSLRPVVESETIMDEKETLANMVDVEETQPEEIPSLRPVVESETIMEEKETLSNTVDVEETQPEEIPSLRPVVQSETIFEKKENLEVEEKRPEPEEITSVMSHQIEEQKAEQDKTEKKEAKNVPFHKSAAPAEHKRLTKKTSGTTKKEHDRTASTSTTKNLTGSKKDEHKAERPKGSATKSASTKPTKPSSATTASKAKTVPTTAASKRPASAQTHKPFAATTKPTTSKPATSKPATSKPATSKPATSKPAANLTSKGTTKTPTRLSESKKPGSASARPTTKDKKPHPLSSGTQKTDSVKSRPRSAVSTKPTDKTDGKVESAAGPAKTKSSATTRTTVKKTTTTTRTTSGPASKNEVSKTTLVTSKGGTTTVKKPTEPSGRTKSSKETPLHQKPLAANKTSEVKNGTHGKPGSASVKAKPASASTKGKPATGKSNSSRPKSPTKGTTKKTAGAKGETVVSGATVHETPSEHSATSDTMKPNITESKDNGTIIIQRTEVIENNGETKIVNTKEVTTTVLENITEPDITAEFKDNDTREIHHTEVIEDDGEMKIVHTKEVTETFLENGEQQTVTSEIVVEESA